MTPSEALDRAVAQAFAVDRYRRGHLQAVPGAVVADQPAEIREALRDLRSDDVTSVRVR